MKHLRYFAAFVLLSCAISTAAQYAVSLTDPPKALIVLLPYSGQRINLLREQGDAATAAQLAEDYAEMRAHMIADFNDNFSYGTFYYLPDTLAYQLAESTDWRGMLLDKDLQPVQNPVAGPADSSVLVAQYGLRARATQRIETLRGGVETSYGDDYLEDFFPSVILTDIHLNPLPRKMRRKKGIKVSPAALRQPKWVYYYRSKRFQIAYNQSAAGLTAWMARTFGFPPGRPE